MSWAVFSFAVLWESLWSTGMICFKSFKGIIHSQLSLVVFFMGRCLATDLISLIVERLFRLFILLFS